MNSQIKLTNGTLPTSTAGKYGIRAMDEDGDDSNYLADFSDTDISNVLAHQNAKPSNCQADTKYSVPNMADQV